MIPPLTRSRGAHFFRPPMSSILSAIVAAGAAANQGAEPPARARATVAEPAAANAGFRVELERFADVRILRYRVPGFETLDEEASLLLVRSCALRWARQARAWLFARGVRARDAGGVSCESTARPSSKRFSFPLGIECDMNKLTAIVCLLTVLPLNGARAQDAPRNGPMAPKVILIIGDGMDQHQITIARDYLAGYQGRLTLDTLPVRSNVQIQTVAEENPSMQGVRADSANTATAMATGIVTSAGRIGTTAGTDLDAPTIMEIAAAAGLGRVSS